MTNDYKLFQYYYDKYGRAIVQKYRQKGIERFGRSFYDKKGQNGSPVPNVNRSGSEPTFWEFVTAILETGELNVKIKSKIKR